MARLGDIKFEADKYFTDTRMRYCRNFKCRFKEKDGITCSLKHIDLDNEGHCSLCEIKDHEPKL